MGNRESANGRPGQYSIYTFNKPLKLKIMMTSNVMQTINPTELERKVKTMYKKVAVHPESKYHFEMGRKLAERLGYSETELDKIPDAAIDSFAGVGYFFDLARIKQGEAVVDLGSGSGMDVFYAANKVGPQGEVLGIDMTAEQLDKARRLKVKMKYDQTYFIDSHIEELPIIPGTIDTVISNGVINLSNNKMKVFLEVARILKPGGVFAFADIVSTRTLPKSISGNTSLWAACIGGAMQVNEYFNYLEHAGFRIEEVKENNYAFISNSAKNASKDYGIRSLSVRAVKK